jgi:hypothetical protein
MQLKDMTPMDGEYDLNAHDRRVLQIGGWLSLTGRLPMPVDRPGPVETGCEAPEGLCEETDPFPRF